MSEENVRLVIHEDIDRYNGYPVHVLHVTWERYIEVEEIPEIVDRVIDETRKLDADSILVLSGRLSFWLYVIISHALTQKYIAVAVFDPKLDGAVVCLSHTPSIQVGSVVPLDHYAHILIERKKRRRKKEDIDDVEALF